MQLDPQHISGSLMLATMHQKGYRIFERPYELNIVGVRSKSVVPNRFDDAIHVFFRNDKYKWIHFAYPATTDPGTYWLNQSGQAQGTAILAQGQYLNVYAIDLHRGKYMALCQRKGTVTVIRDYDRDAVLDFNNGNLQTGWFGINIHRANSTGITKTVDRHSAGCQVLANANDFNQLMQFAHEHRERYGNEFSYTLIDQRAAERQARKKTTYLVGGAIGVLSLCGVVYLVNQNFDIQN